MKTNEKIQNIITDWMTNPRWKGVKRPYTAEEVVRLQDLKIVKSTNFDKKIENSLVESNVAITIVNDDNTSKKEVVKKLIEARLTADINSNSTMIIVKITVNNNRLSVDGKVLKEFFKGSNNLKQEIERGLSSAPYADLICLETTKLNLEKAKVFAEAFLAKYPYKNLAYSYQDKLEDFVDNQQIKKELEKMGYKTLLNNADVNLTSKKNGVVFLNSNDLNKGVYFDAV